LSAALQRRPATAAGGPADHPDGAAPGRAGRARRLWRFLRHEPLVHFILLGGLLFAASALRQSAERETIVIEGPTIEALIRQQRGAWRAGPRSSLLRLLAGIAGAERGAHPFRSPRAFLRRRLDRIAQGQTGELQGHALLLAGMVAAVRGTGRPLVSGEEARSALAVIEAIQRSQACGGQKVALARPAAR